MMNDYFQDYGLVLTIKEACEALRLSPNSVYDLCRNGELKARYIKKKWLIPRQSILEFISSSNGVKKK